MRESYTSMKDSFNVIVNSPNAIKLLLLLFFSSYALKTFIYTTTNSLYNPEISELLAPVDFYSMLFMVSSGLILLIYYLLQNKLNDYLIVGSTLLILTSLVLALYDFLPCLFKHSNSFEDHIHPHTNEYILKQSFLCPSYSQRSRLNLLMLTSFGITTLIISILIKRKRYKMP
ncbi:hypothetical protein SAMN05216474_0472 [Lishizhenia tianjinensis]|uniref:Uncharacterized protein n=1 Tax=Lishizhenia tianjinensis TaxID=477690 RepID=A0A1I6XVP2_9FLAO|nr:hypothetical protein SAMN05216474_0472 [Lishizhenia tianjinensis]